MASSPEKSATILGRLIDSMAHLEDAVDASKAVGETALGVDLEWRDIQLCFGLAPIEPQTASALNGVVVGLGAVRIASILRPQLLFNEYPYQRAFPYADFLGDSVIERAYAYASVCLVHYYVDDEPVTALQVLAMRGGDDLTGDNIFVTHDLSLEEAIELARAGGLSPVQPTVPGTDFSFVELFRVVLDIKSYDPALPALCEITQHTVDLRRPRGFAGYADELMAQTLVTPVIGQSEAQASRYADARSSLYNLVSEWVALNCWSPDFVTFWTTHSDEMPNSLRLYLLEELSINLP